MHPGLRVPGFTQNTPVSHSQPKDSEFTESPGGLLVSGVKHSTPFFCSHPGDSGFPESPGLRFHGVSRRIPRSQIHPEIRFQEVTRRTLGPRSHPEDSGLPESPGGLGVSVVTRRTPGFRSHRIYCSRSNPRLWLPGITHRSPGFRFHTKYYEIRSNTDLRVPIVTRSTTCSRNHQYSGVTTSLGHRVPGVTRRTTRQRSQPKESGIWSHKHLRILLVSRKTSDSRSHPVGSNFLDSSGGFRVSVFTQTSGFPESHGEQRFPGDMRRSLDSQISRRTSGFRIHKEDF